MSGSAVPEQLRLGLRMLLYFSLMIYLTVASLISKELEDSGGRKRAVCMLALMANGASFLYSAYLAFSRIVADSYLTQYIQLATVTPLVVVSVAQLGGVSVPSCFSIAGMDVLFFSCLLLGSQAGGPAPTVAALTAALLFLFAMMALLWTQGGGVESDWGGADHQEEEEEGGMNGDKGSVAAGRARRWYKRLLVWLCVLWVAYAVLWVLGQAAVLQGDARILAYGVVDLFATVLTTILVVFMGLPATPRTYVEII